MLILLSKSRPPPLGMGEWAAKRIKGDMQINPSQCYRWIEALRLRSLHILRLGESSSLLSTFRGNGKSSQARRLLLLLKCGPKLVDILMHHGDFALA